ncbi:MAG: alpha-galactosidase [Bacteroidota bacterium]
MRRFWYCFSLIIVGSFLQAQDLPLYSGELSRSGQQDWLLDNSSFSAKVYRGQNPKELILSNGLIRRIFRLAPNAATIGFDNLMTGESILRGVKAEAEVKINGQTYAVGGLIGQSNYAFLLPEWVDQLFADSSAMRFVKMEVSSPDAPFEWKQVRYHAPNVSWPPKGIHLRMDYQMPAASPLQDIMVSVHYELYDGIPVLAKWISVHNHSSEQILLNSFSSEILAVVEYGSSVETREYNVPPPNLHVETDYAFASMNARDANHHAVHWEADSHYLSQVNYLRQTPCLLKVSPEVGPELGIASGDTFDSFRAFLLPYDSYDRERNGLARRRMYRNLAPWTTENPLMMHARFADWERVKTAIDQAAEVGFDMVILTFGSGFNMEDDSPDYLAKMTQYAEYAREKGVEIGGYSLLASRKIGDGQDVVMPEGESPTFGNSPCIGSEWGHRYFETLYQFYQQTGFSLLEHDGSYPGDVCASSAHPGHQGLEDSRWTQYQVISAFYQWCRQEGIYLNIPDYYYMTGGNKCAMGYREVNWSLPRAEQVIHTRQNIYDGTWNKLVSMGWMFVPLTEYHGGGAAATIEPLEEHLDHYERMMMSNLGAGVQACYRGPRLYDSDKTLSMVRSTIDWYKMHREVLEGDMIHLRRADGRDLDYWLMVNPQSKEKGALVVFNPLAEDLEKDIQVPLYYTGLTDSVSVKQTGLDDRRIELDRTYQISLPVKVPAGKWTVVFFE